MYFDEQEVETVQILADALPKIVPYVLINHREVFYPPLLRSLMTSDIVELHFFKQSTECHAASMNIIPTFLLHV